MACGNRCGGTMKKAGKKKTAKKKATKKK